MRMFGLGKPKVSGSMTVGLTESGKKTAERSASRGPTFAILATLDERSPQSISELQSATQIDMVELKKRLELMAKGGLVRFTGMEA